MQPRLVALAVQPIDLAEACQQILLALLGHLPTGSVGSWQATVRQQREEEAWRVVRQCHQDSALPVILVPTVAPRSMAEMAEYLVAGYLG